MKKQVTGFVFWYSDKTPDAFAWSLMRGALRKRARAKVFRQDGVTAQGLPLEKYDQPDDWPEQFNLMSVRGKWMSQWGEVKTQITYTPSPLSSQYDPWRLPDDRPPGSSIEQTRIYRSLASAERYVRLRHLNEYPHHLEFLFELDSTSDEGPKQLAVQLAEQIVSRDTNAPLRWLGVLDVSPHVLDPIAAHLMLGANEPIADQLDKRLFTPSFLAMGPQATIAAYATSLTKEHPSELYRHKEYGAAAYLVFESTKSVEKAFIADWHLRKRA